jgi:RNA polymerase sigma factor (TIGR02999 family)
MHYYSPEEGAARSEAMATDTGSPNVTEVLLKWSNGDPTALDRLMPLVYRELEKRAKRYLKGERAGHSLETGALVHECYLRLVDQTRMQWQNRSQFYGVAAEIMRRILVDHAKKKRATKRGGDATRVTLGDIHGAVEDRQVEVLALDEALKRLSAKDAKAARVVELRVFGGLSVPEVAEVVGISPATVKRDWTAAKAWLRRELAER